MQITETRNEMRAVIESLRLALAVTNDPVRRTKVLEKARRQIESLRKAFKRRIDDRAQCKVGDQWFSISAREGIERKLTAATQEALTSINALIETRGMISLDSPAIDNHGGA